MPQPRPQWRCCDSGCNTGAGTIADTDRDTEEKKDEDTDKHGSEGAQHDNVLLPHSVGIERDELNRPRWNRRSTIKKSKKQILTNMGGERTDAKEILPLSSPSILTFVLCCLMFCSIDMRTVE